MILVNAIQAYHILTGKQTRITRPMSNGCYLVGVEGHRSYLVSGRSYRQEGKYYAVIIAGLGGGSVFDVYCTQLFTQKFRDLADPDAIDEGQKTVSDLRTSLLDHYPYLIPTHDLIAMRFTRGAIKRPLTDWMAKELIERLPEGEQS